MADYRVGQRVKLTKTNDWREAGSVGTIESIKLAYCTVGFDKPDYEHDYILRVLKTELEPVDSEHGIKISLVCN